RRRRPAGVRSGHPAPDPDRLRPVQRRPPRCRPDHLRLRRRRLGGGRVGPASGRARRHTGATAGRGVAVVAFRRMGISIEEAAGAGFGLGEFPFVIDAYDALPPNLVRQNPAYYHAFLKDAGFESEKGWVDYKITVTPELIERWEGALEAARVAGYDIVPLADVPEDRRVREFTQTWNEAFHDHWGAVPF